MIDYKTESYQDIVSDLDIVLDTLGDAYTLDSFDVIKRGGKAL